MRHASAGSARRVFGWFCQPFGRRCPARYETYPQVRCVRRGRHDTHRSPFGLEWR